MALVPLLNCKIHPKPLSRRNPNFNGDRPRNPARLLENHPFLSVSISERKLRRRRFLVRNNSEEDPAHSPSEGNLNPSENEEHSVGVQAALSFLRFYKREISPFLLKSCRYVPTCSEFSMIAYKKYGFTKGTILTAWRLCRCNPLGGSGFDPPRWFDEPSPPGE